MGQHTSRPPSEQTRPRSPQSHLPPSQAWPRWASSLTHGLPPEGDRGLFRGEFILVQAPMTDMMVRSEESHPGVSNLFRHQFRKWYINIERCEVYFDAHGLVSSVLLSLLLRKARNSVVETEITTSQIVRGIPPQTETSVSAIYSSSGGQCLSGAWPPDLE